MLRSRCCGMPARAWAAAGQKQAAWACLQRRTHRTRSLYSPSWGLPEALLRQDTTCRADSWCAALAQALDSARCVKDLGAVGLPAGAAGGEQEVVPGRLEHGRRLAAQPHQRARILCLARARPASLRSPGTATDAARARGSGAQEQLCRNRCCQAQHRQGCIAIPPSPQHRRAKAGVRLLVIWGGAWRYWSKV